MHQFPNSNTNLRHHLAIDRLLCNRDEIINQISSVFRSHFSLEYSTNFSFEVSEFLNEFCLFPRIIFKIIQFPLERTPSIERLYFSEMIWTDEIWPRLVVRSFIAVQRMSYVWCCSIAFLDAWYIVALHANANETFLNITILANNSWGCRLRIDLSATKSTR